MLYPVITSITTEKAYVLSSTTLSKLQRVPLREVWKHEAAEFTPWLAEQDNLDTLAEVLGLSELVLEATEHSVGDFKLDILCTDGDDQIIIENQLEETDHKHLGQLLAYAAGVGAKKVVWLAQSFRPEHRSALEFLNDNTTDDLIFFGVEVELWRIGDSPTAPKFEVVVKPNDWVKTSRDDVRKARDDSPTKQLQQRFWVELKKYLDKNAPHIRHQAARPQHWLVIAIGRSRFALGITANTRDERIGVELYISGDQANDNFDELFGNREEIEKELGFPLEWQNLPKKKACRIVNYKNDSSIEQEANWSNYLEWIKNCVVDMERVFRPIVRDLP